MLLLTLLLFTLDVKVLSGAAGAGSTSAGGSAQTPEGCDDGQGKYTLKAVISHIGKSTDHGHYVCHVKVDGNWVLFNDEKVRHRECLCGLYISLLILLLLLLMIVAQLCNVYWYQLFVVIII